MRCARTRTQLFTIFDIRSSISSTWSLDLKKTRPPSVAFEPRIRVARAPIIGMRRAGRARSCIAKMIPPGLQTLSDVRRRKVHEGESGAANPGTGVPPGRVGESCEADSPPGWQRRRPVLADLSAVFHVGDPVGTDVGDPRPRAGRFGGALAGPHSSRHARSFSNFSTGDRES